MDANQRNSKHDKHKRHLWYICPEWTKEGDQFWKQLSGHFSLDKELELSLPCLALPQWRLSRRAPLHFAPCDCAQRMVVQTTHGKQIITPLPMRAYNNSIPWKKIYFGITQVTCTLYLFRAKQLITTYKHGTKQTALWNATSVWNLSTNEPAGASRAVHTRIPYKCNIHCNMYIFNCRV